MIPTKERLAQRLHAIGLFELEAKARAGAYSDFESESATPKRDLVEELNAIYKSTGGRLAARKIDKLVREVMEGDFDDTKEEAEAWRNSPDGQRVFGNLTKKAP